MRSYQRFLLAGVLSLSCASCAQSQPAPETKTIELEANAPEIKTELLSTPVRSARSWSTGLAPNARGGWNFITQLYEYRSNTPTEYVVLDLQTGEYSITEGKPGNYTNSNYQYGNQVRAKNGRIFFSELNNVVSYYDPEDEKIKSLGQVIDTKDGDKFIFRFDIAADGKIYGSTQANKLPTVVQIDPETLEHRVIGRVGKNRQSYSYGYYLAADPTPSEGAPQGWVYVGVGQTPWELAALNIATGEQKILAVRADAGWMSFDRRPEGIVGKLTTGLRRPDAKTDRFWLIDGQMYPYEATYDPAKLPFKPRNVAPLSSPIQNPPELDVTQLNADAEGIGRVFWRPAGSKDENAWKEAQFKVKHTSPIQIETLTALPDGSLIGNAKQYHGFFRYNPQTKETKFFGAHGPSGGPRLVHDGKLYITGYPRSILYVYDPAQPWTSNRRQEELRAKNPDATAPPLNPTQLGHFANLTDTHYAYFLKPAANGRLYFGGRRERTGQGGGVGWYEPKTKSFGGHHENLSTLTPRGMVVLDDAERIVYSGELIADPRQPDNKPAEAQLVVYDFDLKEIERLTVKPGLKNTGSLFAAPQANQILGYAPAEKAIYRYDIAQKRLLNWMQLPDTVHDITLNPKDGSLWMVTNADNRLLRLDPATLQFKVVGKLSQKPEIMVWQGENLFLSIGAELHRAKLPR